MSNTIEYVYTGTGSVNKHNTEELAQQDAQQLAENIHNLPCSFCKVNTVEPHPNRYEAWVVNPVEFIEDCRNLSDSDPRFFNISDLNSGETLTAIQAPELKDMHRRCFDRQIVHNSSTSIQKRTYPSNISQDELTGDDITCELIPVSARFNYDA